MWPPVMVTAGPDATPRAGERAGLGRPADQDRLGPWEPRSRTRVTPVELPAGVDHRGGRPLNLDLGHVGGQVEARRLATRWTWTSTSPGSRVARSPG